LVQLLLPRAAHRFAPFAKLNRKYSASFPLVNENATASLGMIGSIGFLALLTTLIFPRQKSVTDEGLLLLASLTLVLVLFSTVGGLSSLFSLLVTPMIRAWNRVSVFIAFTSISASMLIVEHWIRQSKWRTPFALSATISAVALCALAVWDQTTSPCLSCLNASQLVFRSDARFVLEIEKRMPENSMIYQLPYIGFPEVVPVNRLQAYDQMCGYLQSTSLNWSFGAVKGRAADFFFRALSDEPIERQVEIARRIGFSGFYIDRRGYLDNGAAVEAELSRLLGEPPTLTSENEQQAFFDLRGNGQHITALPSDLSPAQIMERAGFMVDALGVRYPATLLEGVDFARPGMPTFISGLNGLSVRESWGRWSDTQIAPEVSLNFAQPLPKRLILHLRAQAFGPNAGKPVTVVIGRQTETFTSTGTLREFSLPFNDVRDSSLIEIRPSQPISPKDLGMSADDRKLGIGLQKLWIESIP
jgi:phosphoglycerol transferase